MKCDKCKKGNITETPLDVSGDYLIKLKSLEKASDGKYYSLYKCAICKKEIVKVTGAEHRQRACSRKCIFSLSKNKSPVYVVWNSMKQRILDKNLPDYKYYGDRGIKICKDWLNDFWSFHDWCLNNGYKKGLQIDRIDNDGNYEPSNCRFITAARNVQNRSTTKLTEKDVKNIRSLYSKGFNTHLIKQIFNISRHTSLKIKKRLLWRNV